MKTFFVFTCSLIFLNFLRAEISTSGTLEVTVTNVENNNGQIRAVLFKGKQGFPGDASKAFKSLSVQAKEGKTVLVFEDIPYGEYAISLLHDQNSNGKMDTNVFGYPQEDYGVSNNATAALWAPQYEEARFGFQEEVKKMLIHLRN